MFLTITQLKAWNVQEIFHGVPYRCFGMPVENLNIDFVVFFLIQFCSKLLRDKGSLNVDTYTYFCQEIIATSTVSLISSSVFLISSSVLL